MEEKNVLEVVQQGAKTVITPWNCSNTDNLAFLTPFTKCRQQKSSIPSLMNINEETSSSTYEEATEREPPESEVQDENYENERVVEESAIDESLLVLESSLSRNKVSNGKRKKVDPLEKCAIDCFTSKKRTQPKTTEDHGLVFLKSLLPDLRQMTNVQKHEFKLKTMHTIGEILYRPNYIQQISQDIRYDSSESSFRPLLKYNLWTLQAK
ncbi:hypothetical protein FQA39_LY00468 [Lamprigera yunnana]|nr:hypothetical protein FQA39_LY00468 [Lamprigera yunnana]